MRRLICSLIYDLCGRVFQVLMQNMFSMKIEPLVDKRKIHEYNFISSYFPGNRSHPTIYVALFDVVTLPFYYFRISTPKPKADDIVRKQWPCSILGKS